MFRGGDALEVRGLEDMLRQDAGAAMRDALDKQVLAGSGTAPEVTGFLADPSAGGLPASDPVAADTPEDWPAIIGRVLAGIDGRYASVEGDIGLALSVGGYKYLGKIFAANTYMSLSRYLRDTLGAVSSSPHVIGAGDGVATGILALRRGGGMNSVAPLWQGVSVIRDVYTHAPSDHVRLTFKSYWNFAILRASGFRRIEFRTDPK